MAKEKKKKTDGYDDRLMYEIMEKPHTEYVDKDGKPKPFGPKKANKWPKKEETI